MKNIPFTFSEDDEDNEYYIDDYNFLEKSGMSDVMKDDLGILFPFLKHTIFPFQFRHTQKQNIVSG